MKKFICTKLFFVFFLNLFVMPFAYAHGGGKKFRQKNSGYGKRRRRDKRSVKNNKFLHRKRKKEKRRKSKEREKVEQLSRINKIRSKMLKEKKRALRAIRSKLIGSKKRKKRRVGIFPTRVRFPFLLVPLLILTCFVNSASSLDYIKPIEIPECVPGYYDMRISARVTVEHPGGGSHEEFLTHEAATYCACYGDPDGVLSLKCDLRVPVSVWECENNWYGVEVDYIVPIHTIRYCRCNGFNEFSDIILLNCNSEHVAVCPHDRRSLSSSSSENNDRRSLSSLPSESNAFCEIASSAENSNATMIRIDRCYEWQRDLIEHRILVPVVAVSIPLACVTGACATICCLFGLNKVNQRKIKSSKKRKSVTFEKVDSSSSQTVEDEDSSTTGNGTSTGSSSDAAETESSSFSSLDTETDTPSSSDQSDSTETEKE